MKIELSQEEANTVLKMISGEAEPTEAMKSISGKLCEAFDVAINPAEHQHKWAGVLGDKWQQCVRQDRHGGPYCGFFRNEGTGAMRKFTRVFCPKGCGLAYYPFESKRHNCWDS